MHRDRFGHLVTLYWVVQKVHSVLWKNSNEVFGQLSIRFFPYIFFFYILFIYLFLTELGLLAAWAFSSCSEQGYSSLSFAGFSLEWLLLFGSTGSRAQTTVIAARRLEDEGSVVVTVTALLGPTGRQ